MNDDRAAASDRVAGEFVYTRVFDAPRELVWKAQSEVDRLKQWWGPKGFKVFAARMDFRPGGMFHYGMRTQSGQEMWGRFVYREIVAPERIVWINSFSDANGGLTRHPGSEDWPLEMLNTMTLAEHEGKTTLTLRVAAHDATESERATFVAGFASMQAGYGGTMDQLAEYLAKG